MGIFGGHEIKKKKVIWTEQSFCMSPGQIPVFFCTMATKGIWIWNEWSRFAPWTSVPMHKTHFATAAEDSIRWCSIKCTTDLLAAASVCTLSKGHFWLWLGCGLGEDEALHGWSLTANPGLLEGKMVQKWKNPLALSKLSLVAAASSAGEADWLCLPAGGRLVRLKRNPGGSGCFPRSAKRSESDKCVLQVKVVVETSSCTPHCCTAAPQRDSQESLENTQHQLEVAMNFNQVTLCKNMSIISKL